MTEERACPRDGSELESRVVGSAEVLVCQKCHGLWLSGHDLAALLRSPYESWKLPWSEMYATGTTIVDNTLRCLCPSRSLMRTVDRKGVSVDLCPDCGGLWFDGGELEQIIRKLGGESYAGHNGVGSEETAAISHAAAIGSELLLEVLLHLLNPL